MSMSRMKVALTNSQTQRPCVSRKWRTEGLGRSEFRSQVHSSAAGNNGSAQSGPSGRTRSSQWEMGTGNESQKEQGRTYGAGVGGLRLGWDLGGDET